MSRESGPKVARISSKIMLAMGSILFLFTVITALFVFFVILQGGMGSIISSPQADLPALQIKASVQEIQKLENKFLLHPDPDILTTHKKAVTGLLSTVRLFTQNAQKQGDNKASADAGKLVNILQKRDSAFLDMVQAKEAKGVSDTDGLLGNLNTTGNELEKIIARNEANTLAFTFLKLQKYQNEYLASGKTNDLRNLRAAIKEFTLLLAGTGIDQVEAQVLRKGIKEYASALDRYQAVSLATNDPSLSVSLTKETTRQADEMNSAADRIESVISRVNVPDVLSMALAVRQNASDYLRYGDGKYVQEVNDSLDALSKKMDSASILQEHKAQAITALEKYREAFTAVVKQDQIIADHLAKLNETASVLESAVNSITPSTKPAANKMPFSISMNNAVLIFGIAFLAVLLIGILIAALLGRSISTPLNSMSMIVRRIADEKDFSVSIPVGANNEIGLLAKNLNSLLQVQGGVSALTREEVTELADKQEGLAEVASELQQQIEEVHESGRRMNEAITVQGEIGEKIKSSVAELVSAVDAIGNVFSRSDEQNQLITDAVEHISRSVEATVEGIKAITQSSSQITDIINLSNEIAEQTNLLALNASVKAARAGSHGKEFAVIADEIAKLAQRSEEIAKEAGELTVDMGTKVDQAVSLGDDSKKSLDQVLEAGRINLAASEDLATQSDSIMSSAAKLDDLTRNMLDEITDMESISQNHDSGCITALQSVEKLLENESSQTEEGQEDEQEEMMDDVLKQAVDNIAISMDEDKSTSPSAAETDGTDDDEEDFSEKQEI